MNRPVYVVHGLGGILPFISRGTRKLDEIIDALPPEAETRERSLDFIQSRWKEIIDDIIEQDAKEIILIGHSLGCERVIRVADWCRVNGVRVLYIAAIDPTAGYTMKVPENVRFVDEFWASSGWPHMARNSRWIKGGKYEYPHGTKHRIFEVDSAHIPLPGHQTVVDRVVLQVGNLVI